MKSLCGYTFVQKSAGKIRPVSENFGQEGVRHFQTNPFDARLRTHKIHRLSGKLKRTIYSVWVEKNLRALFYLEKRTVVSIDIGDHRLYRE